MLSGGKWAAATAKPDKVPGISIDAANANRFSKSQPWHPNCKAQGDLNAANVNKYISDLI